MGKIQKDLSVIEGKNILKTDPALTVWRGLEPDFSVKNLKFS